MLKYIRDILKYMMNKLESNSSGNKAVDGGITPPPSPSKAGLPHPQAETKLSPSPSKAGLPHPQAETKLCFLKFYNYLNIEEKEQWIANFRENMSIILLSKGYQGLFRMFQYLCKKSE